MARPGRIRPAVRAAPGARSRLRLMPCLPLACGALWGAAFPRRSSLAPQSRPRRAPPARSLRGRPAEVNGHGSPRPAQLRPAQLRPAQLRPAQLRPAQLGPAQLGPAQLGPAQLGPAQLGPAQLRRLSFASGALRLVAMSASVWSNAASLAAGIPWVAWA